MTMGFTPALRILLAGAALIFLIAGVALWLALH